MRKIELMYDVSGISADEAATCKTCCHLVKRQYSRVYYKCECYSLSCSDASDWKVSSRACGLYNKHYDGKPIICMVKRKTSVKQPETQIEGQMNLFDELGGMT